jgi:hypothetical protein
MQLPASKKLSAPAIALSARSKGEFWASRTRTVESVSEKVRQNFLAAIVDATE